MVLEITEEITELMMERLNAMDGLPKEDRIRSLIGKAKSHSVDLKDGREKTVVEGLNKVHSILETNVEGRNQNLLLLSAALQHMRKVERFVLDAMRLDRWVTLNEEAILVRIRLICSEVITLLLTGTEELRLVPIPIRK
jgi:hypothetical protein